MPNPNFKYLDRGYQRTLLLVPGWASDHRIFDSLNLRFNYLLPLNFSPFTFECAAVDFLEKQEVKRVSLFGWSLGGFLAADFAAKHPFLTRELILVSIRKSYKEEEISRIKELIKRSKKGYLYKFYSQCFFDGLSLSRFKRDLFKDYCRKFDTEQLIRTLDYLATAKINTRGLSGLEKIKIIHGEGDRIAPVNEAREIQRNIAGSQLIITKNSGHMPFLEVDIGSYL